MKKIKFLSCAFMAAIMALGFTSCEKENFINGGGTSIVIPTPEAEPAVVVINPSVIGFINGIPTNITSDSKIEFNTPKAGTDGTIQGQDITIKVTYTATVEGVTKDIVTEKVVTIPTLSKGMCCTITPTIYLIVNTSSEFGKTEEFVKTDVINGKLSFVNASDYYYTDWNGEYEYLTGEEVLTETITWTKEGEAYKNDPTVLAMINVHNNVKKEVKKVDNIWVYAQSQTILHVETLAEITEYMIQKEVTFSRSSEEPATVDLVSFQVRNYISTTDNASAGPKSETNPNGYDVNINLNGIGHGHGNGHGHGHGGHGHGNDNAGGGIVWGE